MRTSSFSVGCFLASILGHWSTALVTPPDKLVIRALTSHEMLRLYQLPLSMDAFLADLPPDSPLPYEDSAPPGLFTSVLRQLWGVVRGGSTLEEGSALEEDREVEVDEERSVEEDEVEVEEEERSVDEVELGAKMAWLDPGRPFPIGSLDLLAKPWCPASTTATEVTPVLRMTATMLVIQLVDDGEDV